ncbi:ferritin-like protein [Coccomyxa subellipsoidea C-169]|uniref:Ferritin n=1 Tax=Coccomyxa subellipsoidea (strain C-169) TaxID=574566 RepID=I0YRV1_COCSC|nr:ferritin-like protein [Coccomyxa subellipsoidea C-169]EIE21120.1 ferritin-like protein [Coccomyxa subellipsoidea C-169]|eukprot:XP_005645664.1 ferritin-like protein [Coccomyxa subellipsoidea C-169]
MAQAGGSKDFPWAEEVKKELDNLEKAEIGNPKTPLNKTPYLSDEVVDKINEGIKYKYDVALILDSAAAFFGRDNVGLCGVAHFFKIAAVAERADAFVAIEFLNKRGGNVKFGPTAEPPSEDKWHTKEGSDVCKAFVKYLALTKVGYNCAHKLYGQAVKQNDAHTVTFLECCIFESGEKMRELAWFVTHLKAVKGDKHAIKNFDRELECKNCCFAKAAGVEAVVPCKLQIGTMKRKLATETFALSWKFMKDD